MAPRACKLLHIFWLLVTIPASVIVPILIPVRLPLNTLFSGKKKNVDFSVLIADQLILLIQDYQIIFLSLPVTWATPRASPTVEYVKDMTAATMESHQTWSKSGGPTDKEVVQLNCWSNYWGYSHFKHAFAFSFGIYFVPSLLFNIIYAMHVLNMFLT